MTKTKNKKPQKRTSDRSRAWVLVLIIILIIAVIALAIIFFLKPQTNGDADSANPSTSAPEEQTKPSNSEPSAETPTDSEAPESPEKAPQYEGEDPNDLEELTGVVTYKGVDNGILTVMTMINQQLHQTGTCVITLTGQNSRNSYTASVDAHGDISTSYCENFDIPVSELATDVYAIDIKVSGDGKTGIISDEVSL